MENNDKILKFASGVFCYFDMSPKEGVKPSLYFDGVINDTGEHIKRNIKISKYFRCYDQETREKILPADYPDKYSVYKGNIQIETWEWNGYPCMRVLALEVGEFVKKKRNNFDSKHEKSSSENPFINVEFNDESSVDETTELLFN